MLDALLHGAMLFAIADFRVNEVVPQIDGDPAIRMVELFVPAGTFANCLFPSTRLEIFDPQGLLIGSVHPFSATVCYDPGTYFLLATDKAAARFGVTRDAVLDVAVPAYAGQVCLASSQTRYDCARWGPVTGAVQYLRNTDDETAAAPIPDGQALARVMDTGSVALDFQIQSPTPRQPNDGTIWMGPDAGPPPPDAAPAIDASPPDARVFRFPDATPPGLIDATNLDPVFLSADPGGGVVCTCETGGRRAPPGAAWLLGLAAVSLLRRRRA